MHRASPTAAALDLRPPQGLRAAERNILARAAIAYGTMIQYAAGGGTDQASPNASGAPSCSAWQPGKTRPRPVRIFAAHTAIILASFTPLGRFHSDAARG